jgi:histone demethylase JARID1
LPLERHAGALPDIDRSTFQRNPTPSTPDTPRPLGIPGTQSFFNEQVRQSDFWEHKAKEIMAAEVMHYPQLDALQAILTKSREAHKQVVALYERSQDLNFRKRPLYTDIREVMKTLEDLNSKPQGTIDLERELRRHEDWMRKGNKLFGKAHAPLHILEIHMKFVEDKNNFCFDLNDTFRPPVEIYLNEDDEKSNILGKDEKPLFCICRQYENGMMIMCECCGEW